MSVLLHELQKQLLARDRNLDNRKGAIIVRGDGLAAYECALGRARRECDVKRAQAEAVWQDYLARMHTFTSNYQRTFKFDQILEERRIFLSLE
jgi:hypothetical protein